MIYDKDNLQMAMIRHLAALEDRNVLEIGCGDGSLSVKLACSACKYIAIDPDKEAIAKAQQQSGNAVFHICSGENLPYADASFDLVIFILSLHHQNSVQALMEAGRVLNRSGRVIILEPSAEGEFQQFFHLFDDETDALTSAARAIRHSQFDLIRHEVFEVPAEFDDLTDLYQYPFDQSPADDTDRSKILAKLWQFRGEIKEEQAIQLSDRIHIYLLQKRQPGCSCSADSIKTKVLSHFKKENKYGHFHR